MHKNVVVDERLDSYRSFFDYAWSRRVNELADGTALDPLVFDLSLSWNGIAGYHQMPWLMTETVRSFSKGSHEVHLAGTGDVARAVGTRLLRELGDELDPRQRELLKNTTDRMAADCDRLLPTVPHEFNAQELWDQYRAVPQLANAVWNAQRLGFGGLYYAYECFLLRAYETATGTEGYRIYTEKFGKHLAAAFGESVRDRCWLDPEVNIARTVRHVLVHNGGRETDDLRKLGHGVRVEGGELHIMPPHTAALFGVLKVRVEFFVNTTRRSVFRPVVGSATP